MFRLTLDALQTVDAIDRLGSFSAAAEQLHKVPSTVSYTVARLEEQLGIQLFERNGPRVSLTPAGTELLREGRWLLAAAADLEARVQRIATGYETELRLVHDAIIRPDQLVEAVRAFEELRCGTRLRITSEAMTGTWEALREGRADIVVAAGERPAGGGYKAVAVGSLAFTFCVTATHPLAQLHRPLARSDLLEHTAVVVGDGAVGLMGVLAAKELGAERIIAMSRHASRQALARQFGATDIVAERGAEGIARVKELTGGIGAESVLECVGMGESMEQAMGVCRPGGTIGYVGVPHGVTLDGQKLFFAQHRMLGGPAPVRRFLPDLMDRVLKGTIQPGKVFDLTLPIAQVAEGYKAMDERRAIKTLLRV